MNNVEKKAIELIKQYINEVKDKDIKPVVILDTALNIITKLQKENEQKNKEVDMLSKIISLMLDDLDTKGFGKENIYNSYKHRVEHNEQYFQ